MTPPADHSKPFARASLALVGFAWTVPFLQPYHRYPLTAFYTEWLAFAFGLAAALLLARREAWRDAGLPAIALMPPALALLIGLQAAFGRVPYPEQAVTASWYLLWAALLIVLGRVLARELGLPLVARMLAWFLLAGGVLCALAGLEQHYRILSLPGSVVMPKVAARVYGNLGQPNHFAAYLMLAMVSLAYLYASGRMRVAWAAGLAALLLPAVALSGSRGPWAYLVFLAAIALLLLRSRRDAPGRRATTFALLLVPGFVASGLLVAHVGTPAPLPAVAAGEQLTSAQRLFESAGGADPRLQLAAEAWRMFLSAPVLGAGFGQFAWHHFVYVAEAGATTAPGVYNHAHNLVLQLMAETGVAGTLLVVGAAVAWLGGLRGIRLDLEWWWLLALLGIIAAHSMMEFPLWHSYFLGIAAILLGLGARCVLALRLVGFARLTAVFLLVVGGFNVIAVLPYYREFERLVFAPQGPGAPATGELAFTEGILRAHREPLLAPYVELAIAYGVEVNEVKLGEKLDLVSRAARFAPVDFVVYRQAMLLALAGQREAALARFDQASRAYPAVLGQRKAELEVLASRHPGPFMPLLELATSRLAQAARRPVKP